MLVRRILPFAIAAAIACPAWSQVSTAVPPQTIGTLSTDREPPTDLQQVQQLIVSKRLPQALARADEHLVKNPRDAQMRFVRGVILTEMKQTEQAREVFQKLTEEFPELPEPYNNLAVIYASEGRLGDIYLQMAADAYQRASKLDPANRQAGAKLSLSREMITKARGVR